MGIYPHNERVESDSSSAIGASFFLYKDTGENVNSCILYVTYTIEFFFLSFSFV